MVRKERRRTTGVQEQDRPRIREAFAADAIQQAGHGFAGVDRVQQQPLVAGQQAHRIERAGIGFAVTRAEVVVPQMNGWHRRRFMAEQFQGALHQSFDFRPLRRVGAPYELAPGDLAAQAMVSSGAVTKRVDRCVEQGLVTRRVGDGDARSRVVALTDKGLDVIDRAFEAHMANEQRLVGSLDEMERARLAHLLEKWGRALDA